MKIVLFKRKVLTVLACLLAAAAMFYAVHYPAAVSAAAGTRQLPIYCVQRDQKLVSISFDAAWGDGLLRPILFLERKSMQKELPSRYAPRQ